ncbi:TrmH family RNA methyltransferase [Alteromonas sp. ASW11-130]|uniref:TrmH family RNA methyltransferase n=1 Tax=Alteromonas sp. ASW11-130 TaxID=3015775 RepID=UPI002241EA8D|nr:RNA methyltransferase [Alteromonas sp. ASW11-130]MCW8093201.1 RNA methyltransferase [Alteromonas sp. ASW11-130]
MKLDDVKKLHHKKYRNQFGYFLVEGEHLILELFKAVKAPAQRRATRLFITEDYQNWAESHASHWPITLVSKKQMSQLSDTKTPQGIVACVPFSALDSPIRKAQHTKKYIYLHEIQDPGNLGTIMRTLAWFGNFSLLLSPNSVDPHNSKVIRASMGAIFHLPMEQEVPLHALPERFDNFAYLDLRGKPVTHPDFNNYSCYLFGNEARGVPQETLSAFDAKAFTIPGKGEIESLNVASALGICAFQLSLE